MQQCSVGVACLATDAMHATKTKTDLTQAISKDGSCGKVWELWDRAKFRPGGNCSAAGPRSEDLQLAQTANWIPPEEISMRKMEHRMARFALPGQPNELA